MTQRTVTRFPAPSPRAVSRPPLTARLVCDRALWPSRRCVTAFPVPDVSRSRRPRSPRRAHWRRPSPERAQTYPQKEVTGGPSATAASSHILPYRSIERHRAIA
ncbi:hypothetical protein EVAR_46698_1 [Eumeta japonica]|uniref:Uncharacterized protein n=1 Tax=Eumeta variegata TaxID=151549 RepID=A0A4C1Y4A3_EUMVA|nr:hypothetical protein EVAR_46698_1 [Eumeta japonica]